MKKLLCWLFGHPAWTYKCYTVSRWRRTGGWDDNLTYVWRCTRCRFRRPDWLDPEQFDGGIALRIRRALREAGW